MKELKEKVLNVIEKNSKIGVEELAVLLGEPAELIANCIFEMEQDHVICGYHTMIDWNKTNADIVTALIEVRVTPQRGIGFDRIAERIYNFPEVQDMYLISGGYDFMLILEGKTLQEVAMFVSDKLSTLDSVLSTATHFVLKKYKEHGTMFVSQTPSERMLMTP